MKQIMFSVNENLDRNFVKETVNNVPGIVDADQLFPYTKNPVIALFWFAYVNDQVEINEVLKSVSSLEFVKEANLPNIRTVQN